MNGSNSLCVHMRKLGPRVAKPCPRSHRELAIVIGLSYLSTVQWGLNGMVPALGELSVRCRRPTHKQTGGRRKED